MEKNIILGVPILKHITVPFLNSNIYHHAFLEIRLKTIAFFTQETRRREKYLIFDTPYPEQYSKLTLGMLSAFFKSRQVPRKSF